MYSASIKKRLFDLLALSALLLFIVLEVIGCKDVEDCRSLYDTNRVYIAFKGTRPLTIKSIDIEEPTGPRTIVENIDPKNKVFTPTLPVDKNKIKFLVNTNTDNKNVQTITLHYHTNHSLLSPSCGIQTIYIIDKVETSFQGSIIVAPEGKITNLGIAGNDKSHVEISY